MGRAIPLLTLWAFVGCHRENFTIGLLSLLTSKHLAVVGTMSRTFFVLEVLAILRVLFMESKGSVKKKADFQSKSLAPHPVVNKFAKKCNTNTTLGHTYMELFMLDDPSAARLSTCQIF